jgi:guanine nucleotide-binding protein G(I)/G(S)/G(T) subunit beta-1
MATSVQQAINLAREDSNRLKEAIRKNREETDDAKLEQYVSQLTVQNPTLDIRSRRLLQGHGSKIYSVAWSSDSERVVSASQDGRLIIWDPKTETKLQLISLRSCWVMAVAYSQSGNLVASGGLDNICTIHAVQQDGRIMRELNGHSGYLSNCKFIGDQQVLSSSGDMSCILWDLDQGRAAQKFTGHTGDVMSVSAAPDRSTFVSAAVDCTAKIWDIRSGKCVLTFVGHEGDINAVHYLPNGMGFATGSDDATVRLFDVRANRQLISYQEESVRTGVTSVSFSHSGRFLFASYDDNKVIVWDTISGKTLQTLKDHAERVSCLTVSPNGMALCTASWDKTLRIWA